MEAGHARNLKPGGGWLALAVNVVVSGAFVYLVFGHLDYGQFRSAIGAARLPWIALALLTLGAGFAVRIARWSLMLRCFQPRVSVLVCAGPFLASYAVNNVLPFRAGDVVRAVMFREELGCTATDVLGTLLVERLLDVLALLLFLFIGFMLLPSGAIPPGWSSAALTLLGGVAAALVASLSMPGRLGAVFHFANRLTRLDRTRLGGRLGEFTRRVVESLQRLNSVTLLVRLIVLSVVAWGIEGTGFALVAWSITTELGAYGGWFAMATATLGTMLPSTPGYIGTFDYFGVTGLTLFGAEREAATAITLVAHLLLWVGLTVAGGAYLWGRWGSHAWKKLRTTTTGAASDPVAAKGE